MRKVRFDVIAPFLLTTYPIVFFYSTNFFIAEITDVLATVVVALCFSSGLLALFSLLARHRQRGLFITSVVVLLFFFYGHVFNILQTFRHIRFFPFDKHPNLQLVWLLILIAALVLAFTKTHHLQRINRALGMIAGALLAISLLNIGFNALAHSPEQPQPELNFEVNPPDTLPDVYYIVLDEYAGNPTLLNNLGFDNSQFTNSLEARGFRVIEHARSNYYWTIFSLASTLNMQYLDSLYGNRSDDTRPAIGMVRNNLVVQAFRKMGYTYVHFATGVTVNKTNAFADIIYDGYDEQRINIGGIVELNPKALGLHDFHITLAKTTLLAPFMETVELNDNRVRNLFNFEKLTEIPAIEGPTFTFAHFILPHPPYVFDQTDGPVDPDQPVDGHIVDPDKYTPFAGYIDQVIFTNRAVSQVVDEILNQSETEPIIIIQSDHGFRWWCSDCYEESKTWTDEHYADVILPVLSAYYLPDGGDEQLYETMSPVNIFRVIFDYYFNADLGLLDDHYYRPEDYYSKGYHFQDITELVQEQQRRNLN